MLHKIYSSLVVSPTNTNQYVLIQSFRYKSKRTKKEYTIQKGYVTKAGGPASNWAYEPASTALTLPALILHDYLCSEGNCSEGEIVMQEILKDRELSTEVIYGMRVKNRRTKTILNALRKGVNHEKKDINDIP